MASESDQQRLWFVGEVLKLLGQCFTNLKLYPREHVRCQRALETFAGRLRSYLSMHDGLRFQITQDTLLLGGETVYEESNRGENLAFRLYIDGLRELRIGGATTKDEAEQLAFVLSQALHDPALDTTNLFWEGGFTNVEYVAINSLAEALDPADFLSDDAADLINDMNSDVDRMVDTFSKRHVGSGDQYSFELSDGAAELRRVADLDVAEEQERTDQGKDIFEVEEAALERVRHQTLAWGPDRVLQVLVNTGLDALAMAPKVVGRDTIEWLLTESLETAIRSQNMELLSALLERFKGEIGLAEGPEAVQVLERSLAWTGQPDNLRRLDELVQQGGLGGPDAFCKILSLIGSAGIDAAVETFQRTESRELRTALQAFISEQAGERPDALAPLIRSGEPEVARSALFIVSKKVTDEPDRRRLLELGRGHPDRKIQEYASHLWTTLTEEGRMSGLISMLDSPQRAERTRGVMRILEGQFRSALGDLERIIRQDEFLTRDKQERQAFIDAVAYLGGLKAVAFLEEQSERYVRIFNRKAAKEVREAAKAALGQIRRKSRGDGA